MKLNGQFKRSAMMVPDAAAVLKRLHFVQRELVRIQAGWTPGMEHWETKLQLPEALWQDELTSWQLRERVLDLRYPERRIEPHTDQSCLEFWRALADAPNGSAFATALYAQAKDAMAAAINSYLDAADPLNDAPTARFLRHALLDIEQQRTRDAAIAPDRENVLLEHQPGVREWSAAVKRAFALLPPDWWNPAVETDFTAARQALSGVPFSIARCGVRDRRFNQALFSWPDSLEPARGAGEGFELQVRQAQAHLNEIWAAEMAAACLHDLMDSAPPEFLHDAARWCFDEVRHCRMGYTRFLDWGFAKSEMPLGSFSYDLGKNLDPITRLGVIFYFETSYILTKWISIGRTS